MTLHILSYLIAGVNFFSQFGYVVIYMRKMLFFICYLYD